MDELEEQIGMLITVGGGGGELAERQSALGGLFSFQQADILITWNKHYSKKKKKSKALEQTQEIPILGFGKRGAGGRRLEMA